MSTADSPPPLVQHLAAYIARQAGAQSASVLRHALLSGGAIQENHGLSLELDGGSMPGRHHFVVRCDAPSAIATSLSRAQEFAVLRAAFEAGVAVPRPYWLCDDASVIGAAFYVMAWAPGNASGRKITGGALSAAQARALTRRLGEELGRLHAVEPPREALAFLPVPTGNPARARLQTYCRNLDELGVADPVLEYAIRWLDDRAPPEDRIVLSHCDYRTGNYLVEDGQLSAILDWEFAAWSDPHEDLGWLCARSWRFAAPAREVGGVGEKADLFAGYEAATGRKVDAEKVRYWGVMASLRWAVIALQQAARHASGAQRSLELALTGRMVPEIEQDLLRHIEEAESCR